MPDHANTIAECPGTILQQLHEAEVRLREAVVLARQQVTYCQQALDLLATAQCGARRRLLPALSSVCQGVGSPAQHCGCQDTIACAPTIVAPSGVLTPRESEILNLIAAGLSNREIADRLFLSPRTVERHIANLYLKLDVHTKAEAIDHVRRHGREQPTAKLLELR